MQQDLFITLLEQYLEGKSSQQESHLLEEYYTRLGQLHTALPPQEAARVQQDIFSELQARIHAAGSVKTAHVLWLRSTWWAVAALLCVLAMAAALFLYHEKSGAIVKVENRLRPSITLPSDYDTLVNRTHGVIDTLLPDGTRVWLNEHSSLVYPRQFTGNERSTTLAGEAFFDVKHDANHPFRIKASNELIEDLGTRFNICAYPSCSVKVTLVEGLLRVNGIVVHPGQQFANGRITKADTAAAMAWLDAFREDETISFTKFPEERSLTLQKFLTQPYAPIRNMYLAGDTALITFATTPKEGEHYFNTYSLSTRKCVDHYVESPTDVGVSIATFSGFHRGETLWMYDFSSQYFITTQVRNLPANTDPPYRTHRLSRYYYNVQLMDSLKMVGNGAEHTLHEIQELDLAQSRETADYGNLPPTPEGTIPLVWKEANHSFLYLKPSEEKIVTCARYTDVVKIYDRRTKHSKTIKGPEQFGPEFTTIPGSNNNPPAMKRTAKTRIAFQNGAVTNKYIYLLYSGHPEEQRYVPDSKTRGAGQYILVYDWNGNPIRKFTLDRLVTGFVVSEDNATLYANHNITDPSIIYQVKIGL